MCVCAESRVRQELIARKERDFYHHLCRVIDHQLFNVQQERGASNLVSAGSAGVHSDPTISATKNARRTKPTLGAAAAAAAAVDVHGAPTLDRLRF